MKEAAPKDAAGQALRAARCFGLVAVAGKRATHYGLTGRQEGAATNATRKCFAVWLESFGVTGNREERAIRAGFFRTGTNGEREFMLLPEPSVPLCFTEGSSTAETTATE